MYQQFQYIKYLLGSRTRYTIHSPYVYDWVNEVLRDRKPYNDYHRLEAAKEKLWRDRNVIETVDFGAGSGEKAYATRVTPLGKLVKRRSQRPAQLELLYRIARHHQPEVMLEFGTAAGVSAAYLKAGYPDGELTSMEGCAALSAVARQTLESLQLDQRSNLITGPFHKVLPGVLKELTHVDLVFFDGNHRKEPTLDYFRQCLPLARKGTLFLFDDIHWSKGMHEAWNTIVNDPSVSLSIDLFWLGVVVFRKGMHKQHLIIRP